MRDRPSSESAVPPLRGRSWWLREALADDPGEPCPPLRADLDPDVVVLGGGYTGMWTAFFLSQLAPGLEIVVLEQDICGGGPSGRNGGFVTGWWDELPDLVDLYGETAALAACRAVGESVRAIGEWCRSHHVDAWYRPDGYLTVSTSPAQDGASDDAVALAARLGAADELVRLSPAEVRARFRSPVARGGALMRDGATVQPARMARGLRRVLLGRGVRIFEGTPVSRFRAGPPALAETPGGTVRAGRAVVALNAWAGAWRAFRRSLVTWGSYIVLTAPAPDRLEQIGWTGGECICDERLAHHYFRTTPDGRVAFGGGGGRVGVRRSVGPWFDHDEASVGRAVAGLRRLLPGFDGVPMEEAWGGPIDVSASHVPTFGTLPAGNVHFGHGYSGNGVGPSHLGGRILAALALDRDDDVTRLPIVHAEPRPFLPQPLRSIGAHLVREAIVRKDLAEDEGRRAGRVVDTLAGMPRRLGYRWGPH